MDSLTKLNTELDRIDDCDYDHDVKTINKWLLLKGWAKDLIQLDENISNTSLNNQDRNKRLERAISEIKPI